MNAELAFPNWTLLLDHEGETFTALTASQIGASDHSSDEHAASEPVGSHRRGSILSIAAEIELAFPNWTLLLDHEGESFTALTVSQIGASDHLSDTATQPVQAPAPALGGGPVRRFLVADEDVAAFSASHEQPIDPETTGSTSSEEPEKALDGYEDR